MEPLVSVIIPETEDDTYLIRCLNAIRRQTYKNIEIINIGNIEDAEIKEKYTLRLLREQHSHCEALNEAIRIARGEYVMFCETSMVMAPNTIGQLLDDSEKKQGLFTGKCCVLEGNNLNVSSELNIYGKLFKKEIIEKKNLKFEELSVYADIVFLLYYLSECKTIETNDDVFIYGTKFPHMLNECEFLTKERIEAFEEICAESFSDKSLVIQIWNQIIRDCITEEAKMIAAKGVAHLYHKNYEMNYHIMKDYVGSLFKKSIVEENEAIFEHVKEYLKLFEREEDFFITILPIFEMNHKRYEIFLRHSLAEYAFLKDKTIHEMDEKTLEIASLNETVNTIARKIEVLNKEQMEIKRLVGTRIEKPISTENKISVSGPELAEYVVDSYYQGRLGIKTLLRALRGWIKYKF